MAKTNNRPVRTVFGERFRDLLKKKGLSVKRVAAAAQMHVSLVYYYINGQRIPSTASIFRLAKALGVKPAEVFSMVDENDFAVVSENHK